MSESLDALRAEVGRMRGAGAYKGHPYQKYHQDAMKTALALIDALEAEIKSGFVAFARTGKGTAFLAQIAELEKDAARLDWLESNRADVDHWSDADGARCTIATAADSITDQTLRSACDAAMSEEKT